MQPPTVHIAALGIEATQLRALVAASRLLSSRLPAALEWTEDAARADIVIIDESFLPDEDQRLAAHAVLLGHAACGTADADTIVRPLRMPQVERVLHRAVALAASRMTPAAAPSGSDAQADTVPVHQPAAKTVQKIYRGRAVTR